MSKIILKTNHLAKHYHDGRSQIRVLRNVNLTLHSQELIAIVGHSGSGKSTLLHLLGTLEAPTKGNIIFDGQNVAMLNESQKCLLRNQKIGFVYQFHHLLPEFSALENVAMPLLIQGIKVKKLTEKACYLLDKVGLKDRLQHKVSQLSGGERQRVAIVRALITNPLCMLADEPTGNLDPENAMKVLDLFIELQNTLQTSVIIVTHDMSIAKKAKRILFLENGELLESVNH